MARTASVYNRNYALTLQQHARLATCVFHDVCGHLEITSPAPTAWHVTLVGGRSVEWPLNQQCASPLRVRSRRNSVWANSALVVNVGPSDWGHHTAAHGVLAGVAFQQEMEREAARRGGGGLVAPVQRAADYVQGVTSTGQLPTSSYRRVSGDGGGGWRSECMHVLRG